MQTGLVRENLCPEGWPRRPATLVRFLVAASRFAREDTCQAFTVKKAMTALLVENDIAPAIADAAWNPATLDPLSPADAEHTRAALLRLCDWIESRLHVSVHSAWYNAPDCFDPDPRKSHLANIGIAQRHIASFSERDRERWEDIHTRAASRAPQSRLRSTPAVFGGPTAVPPPETAPALAGRLSRLQPC